MYKLPNSLTDNLEVRGKRQFILIPITLVQLLISISADSCLAFFLDIFFRASSVFAISYSTDLFLVLESPVGYRRRSQCVCVCVWVCVRARVCILFSGFFFFKANLEMLLRIGFGSSTVF